MCLILFKYEPEGVFPLTVLANRDEFYQRRTSQADFWDRKPNILAGRDLEKGGTWMGVTTEGRFAAVTNYRSLADMNAGGRSRGELPVAFLEGSMDAMSYLNAVMDRCHDYTGFNLLVFDGITLGYASNRSGKKAVVVPPGIHGLSNALLNTDWPKVSKGRAALRGAAADGDPKPSWMNILSGTEPAPDEDLPDTGIGLEKERLLSSPCIISDDYGTRCSTFVTIRRDGHILFREKTLIPEGLDPDTVEFAIEPG